MNEKAKGLLGITVQIHSDRSKKIIIWYDVQVRLPGFEPGFEAWEAPVITTRPQPLASTESWI
jgi:hypothetical protein